MSDNIGAHFAYIGQGFKVFHDDEKHFTETVDLKDVYFYISILSVYWHMGFTFS